MQAFSTVFLAICLRPPTMTCGLPREDGDLRICVNADRLAALCFRGGAWMGGMGVVEGSACDWAVITLFARRKLYIVQECCREVVQAFGCEVKTNAEVWYYIQSGWTHLDADGELLAADDEVISGMLAVRTTTTWCGLRWELGEAATVMVVAVLKIKY